MKITYSNKTTDTRYDDLNIGQTFIFSQDIFKENPDVYIKTDKPSEALDITSGCYKAVPANTKTVSIDCKCEVYL